MLCEDVIGADRGWDVVLAGDVAYERDMAAAVFAWLEGLARRGALVLVGDPRRSYLALDRLECVAEYSVPTTRALEDAEIKRTGRVHVPLGARNRLRSIIAALNRAPFGPYLTLRVISVETCSSTTRHTTAKRGALPSALPAAWRRGESRFRRRIWRRPFRPRKSWRRRGW